MNHTFQSDKNLNERQYKLGKKTASERIELLIDPNSFEEIDQLVTSQFLEKKFAGDGVITGFATIAGKKVALYAQDFTKKGGSLGLAHSKKITKIMDMAAKTGCPIISIIDSGGARIDEGIHALGGYGEIFMRSTRYSGVIPQISVILGPCAGGAVYAPALTDFIFVTKKISQMFITGPQVVKQALHETVTKEDLGGATVHSEKSGVAHFIDDNEEDCLERVKQLLSYLPGNYEEKPPAPQAELSDLFEANNLSFVPAKEAHSKSLSSLVPENKNKSYDIRAVIREICDEDTFLEIHENFAKNIVVGFARLDKAVIGIVANQPLFKAGVLDINASCKAARFIRFCDSFGIPIISLVDIPGFLPGIDQEHNGIIKHGAKLLSAYAEATVPKITLILRKAFGGAYIVMGSKHLGADFNFAWPQAEIAVLGTHAGVEILYGKKLRMIEDPQEREIRKKSLETEYAEKFLNPFTAAEFGYIDAIIEPNATRGHLIKALSIVKEKVEKLPDKKHGNIPL